MSDGAGENEDAQKRQWNDERVKVAVISSADAVAHPRAVMIKAL